MTPTDSRLQIGYRYRFSTMFFRSHAWIAKRTSALSQSLHLLHLMIAFDGNYWYLVLENRSLGYEVPSSFNAVAAYQYSYSLADWGGQYRYHKHKPYNIPFKYHMFVQHEYNRDSSATADAQL